MRARIDEANVSHKSRDAPVPEVRLEGQENVPLRIRGGKAAWNILDLR